MREKEANGVISLSLSLTQTQNRSLPTQKSRHFSSATNPPLFPSSRRRACMAEKGANIFGELEATVPESPVSRKHLRGYPLRCHASRTAIDDADGDDDGGVDGYTAEDDREMDKQVMCRCREAAMPLMLEYHMALGYRRQSVAHRPASHLSFSDTDPQCPDAGSEDAHPRIQVLL